MSQSSHFESVLGCFFGDFLGCAKVGEKQRFDGCADFGRFAFNHFVFQRQQHISGLQKKVRDSFFDEKETKNKIRNKEEKLL